MAIAKIKMLDDRRARQTVQNMSMTLDLNQSLKKKVSLRMSDVSTNVE